MYSASELFIEYYILRTKTRGGREVAAKYVEQPKDISEYSDLSCVNIQHQLPAL